MSSAKINRLCQRILEVSFGLLFTLTPLVFTTVNYELFEFNKMVFVYLMTVIILGAWITKIIIHKKIIFQKTPLFWPLLIFLTSQVATTLTSIDRHTSFWGYYTRQNGGLLSTIAYLLLFFALVSNINSKKTKKYLKCSLASLVVVSFYGVLQKLGVDKHFWTQDVRARVFSTLGQPNWLAAWINSVIFLTVAFALLKPKNLYPLVLLFSLAYIILLFTRSRSGFLAFWLVYPLLWLIFTQKNLKAASFKKSLVLFTVPVLILTILFLSPFPQINNYLKHFSPTNPQSLPKWSNQDNNNVVDPDLGSATADIRKTVWQGAISIFKNQPFLGTGPETFAYSYYWHQPQSHNLLSEWDFLYNKAHNEYLNYLSTTGLVGFLAYTTLIITTLFFLTSLAKKKNQHQIIYSALLGSYLTILITNFFGFSVVAINLWFFLIPALAYSLTSQPKSVKKFQLISDKQKFLLIVTFLVFLNLIFLLSRYWLADYYFTQAERQHLQGQYSQAHLSYQKAIKFNPKEPFYSNKMAYNCAYLSVILYQEKNTQEAANFTHQAKELAQKTINSNPYQLNFYRQQSQTYYLLSQVNSDFLKQSQQLLLEAHRLAPVNPKITYNLAVLAYHLDDLEQGINWLRETVRLKPDYQEAYYWLAKFYQENNQSEEAKETLNFLINHLNPEHQEGKSLLEKIDN